MTEQQQAACAELARRIGWREGELAGIWFPPDGNLKRVQADPPDYFTDPDASRELVAWLAADDEILSQYIKELWRLSAEQIDNWKGRPDLRVKILMTPPLPVIARAACKALGIEVKE